MLRQILIPHIETYHFRSAINLSYLDVSSLDGFYLTLHVTVEFLTRNARTHKFLFSSGINNAVFIHSSTDSLNDAVAQIHAKLVEKIEQLNLLIEAENLKIAEEKLTRKQKSIRAINAMDERGGYANV